MPVGEGGGGGGTGCRKKSRSPFSPVANYHLFNFFLVNTNKMVKSWRIKLQSSKTVEIRILDRIYLPFPKQALFFTCLLYKSFGNTVGKGDIARNE